jgi:hypothetical protein
MFAMLATGCYVKSLVPIEVKGYYGKSLVPMES